MKARATTKRCSGLSFCLAMLALLAVAGNCPGVFYYWNGNLGSDWADPNNWELLNGDPATGYPQAGDRASIEGARIVGADLQIQPGDNLVCYEYIQAWDPCAVNVTMTGGTLTASYFRLASWKGTGVLEVSGGVLNVNAGGGNGNAWIGGGDDAVEFGDGTLTLTGGAQFNVTYLLELPNWTERQDYGKGLLNLHDGIVTCGLLKLNPGGRIDLQAGGELRFAGYTPDQCLALADQWIADGLITAYADPCGVSNPRSQIIRYFDNGLYKCVVTATDPGDLAAAWDPRPGNLAGDQRRVAILQWEPGDGALSHDVYFGTDPNVVAAADTATAGIFQGNQDLADTSFYPGPLALGQTYYWRIDEVGPGGTTAGAVWQFTVSEDYVIDNFESYRDTAALEVYWTDPNILDTDVAHTGGKSMEFHYDNTAGPYRTEVVFAYQPVQGAQDWTADGAAVLAVYFQGAAGNDADTVYVVVEDAFGARSSPVVYDGPAADLQREPWQTWSALYVNLADIAGSVDLTRVQALTVGVGNPLAPQMGGTGKIYIDDVVLLGGGCYQQIAADIVNNCLVDLFDFEAVARDFGAASSAVNAADPGAAGLLIHYRFNQSSGFTVTDETGAYNGIVVDGQNHWDTAGYQGNCLLFNDTFGVLVPKAAFNTVADALTVSIWVNGAAVQPVEDQIFYFGNNAALQFRAGCPGVTTGHVDFFAGDVSQPPPYGDYVSYVPGSSSQFKGQWNHYAFVKDAAGGLMRIYLNGVVMAETDIATQSLANLKNGFLFYLGSANGSSWGSYSGRLDEFRLYNRALSQAEVAFLAGQAQVTQPVGSPADVTGDGQVDFQDVAAVTQAWLLDVNWP